ncbi:MAG: response regulator [Anaerolineae bacterium]|nr:response regulator [Anaerolineae bacterium]
MTKILVVDDDPSGTNLLITLLGFEGYQGIKPENWADPIEDIARERPDLVMMDVRLMQRDGVEVLRQLRSHPDPGVASTPVLMMSAEDQTRRCRGAGANGFIEKPFDRVKLLQRIESLLEESVEES